MFNRFKNVVIGAVSSLEANGVAGEPAKQRSPKFVYERPNFLSLTEDDTQVANDHKVRPIIHPSAPLPYFAGYAECCNAGKSKLNEDLAAYSELTITKIVSSELKSDWKKFPIPYTYYALFDGHAGVGAAMSAYNDLNHLVHLKLLDALDDIWTHLTGNVNSRTPIIDSLIIGALEAAFREMDQVIDKDRTKYLLYGGCTAIVSLFILGKLYVANAGDSRAIICSGKEFTPMSTDFTPENERDRIRMLATQQPQLLGEEFTAVEYSRTPKTADLGKHIRYRDATMTGWAYKLVQPNDLKVPVITGQGKRSRVMGTIGVTRGFGDHDLLSVYQRTPIKPFLSCHPEVRVHYLAKASDGDVLVMGTDGLWDVISRSKAADIVLNSLNSFKERDRYVSAATCLVGAARGSMMNGHYWQLKDGKPSSADDISVFVIPILPYKLEYDNLLKRFHEEYGDSLKTE